MIRRIERKGGTSWEVFGQRKGKKRFVGTYYSEREAKDADADFAARGRMIDRGELPEEDDGKRTVAEGIALWLTSLEKRGSRSHEAYTDRANLYILPELGPLQLTRLNTPRIMEWRDVLAVQYMPATVNGVLGCLASFLTFAVAKRWLDENPCRGVARIERPEGVYRWIQTREEITKLLVACPDELRDMVAVAVGTGIRLDELICLQHADVDVERRLIAVHRGSKGTVKNGKGRRIPILDSVLPVLRRRALNRDGNALVFPGRNGKQRTAPGIRDPFKLAVKRAGLDTKLRWHDLRHTFASHWMLSSGDIYALSKILGHHSVTVTEVYAHLRPDAWERDYHRVAFTVPSETRTYQFSRDAAGRVVDRVLVAV